MLKVKGKMLPPVPTAGRTHERVPSTAIVEALGAQATDTPGPKPQGPVALLTLRQGLAARLQSTGGRPGLGEGRRQKIPLSDADWVLLCELSEALADNEHPPTPGQIASELLHQRLREVHDQLAREGAPRRRTRSQTP